MIKIHHRNKLQGRGKAQKELKWVKYRAKMEEKWLIFALEGKNYVQGACLKDGCQLFDNISKRELGVLGLFTKLEYCASTKLF